MFGYIKPFKPDLRVRELDTYKAVYCGLCEQLGKSFGPAARLTLSYDFVFLAMLHYSACGDNVPVFRPGRCCVNPLKKQPVCVPDETLSFSADVALLMLYYKLLDNMSDSGTLGRIGWATLRPFAAAARTGVLTRLPDCDTAIASCMARQRELEQAGSDNIDAACEPTAKAMSEIFTLLSDASQKRRILERTGYLIGRYVYLCDALDDLPSDIRSGSYNPFAMRYKLNSASGAERLREAYAGGREALYLTAGEAAKAYQLLDADAFAPILDNIFYQGLRAGVDEILLRRLPDISGLLPEGPESGCAGCAYRKSEDV